MAEPQLGAREAIEYATEDQPQRVRSGLERPLPGGAAQPVVTRQHRRWRNRVGRMDIDQRAERLGALPERGKRGIVEVLSVGVSVDHRAAELQLVDAALKLVGRGLGVL